MRKSTDNDQIIWELPSGSRITPVSDLHEERNPELPRWFTAGQEYVIDSMHPIADPPFVRVKTDEGQFTKLYAEHIEIHFRKV